MNKEIELVIRNVITMLDETWMGDTLQYMLEENIPAEDIIDLICSTSIDIPNVTRLNPMIGSSLDKSNNLFEEDEDVDIETKMSKIETYFLEARIRDVMAFNDNNEINKHQRNLVRAIFRYHGKRFRKIATLDNDDILNLNQIGLPVSVYNRGEYKLIEEVIKPLSCDTYKLDNLEDLDMLIIAHYFLMYNLFNMGIETEPIYRTRDNIVRMTRVAMDVILESHPTMEVKINLDKVKYEIENLKGKDLSDKNITNSIELVETFLTGACDKLEDEKYKLLRNGYKYMHTLSNNEIDKHEKINFYIDFSNSISEITEKSKNIIKYIQYHELEIKDIDTEYLKELIKDNLNSCKDLISNFDGNRFRKTVASSMETIILITVLTEDLMKELDPDGSTSSNMKWE